MNEIVGLSNEEVKKRIHDGKVNYDTTTPSKTIKQILLENTCTLFNFINIILAIAIIIVGSYKNLFFLGTVVCNTLISVFQEIRAKKIVDKLSIISSSKSKVIRNGEIKEIGVNEIVLDDVITYELGNQIVTDSKIIKGECEVNESFITGESKTILKKEGDILLSGSFIVSGNVTAKVIHVGIDNYTSVISKDAKEMKKEISSQIMKSLNKIVKYVSIVLVPVGILLLLKQFSIESDTQKVVTSVVAAVIGMIPEGLILLVSTVLGVSVVRLSKYNVLVQDLYSIETLARVDTLCLDKTGTITEGVMEVVDVIASDDYSMSELENVLEIISTNLDDKNPTFIAINNKYKNNSMVKADKTISFSSDKKYSGVVVSNHNYILGAPEIILGKKYEQYKKDVDKYSKENRVLAVVDTKNNSFDNVKLMGFVLISDKIRKEAYDTLKFFNDNDVDLIVISGDNPKTVASIANKAGVDVRGVYDARNLNENSDIEEIVIQNNVFGRVKPEQKRLIIKTLKKIGRTVAMTGDGVNDVLALKEADCGVAMNSGSDAARNVSELVLLDSNFSSMPEVIKEGRKTINNVERSATLFLSKTIYSCLLAVIFIFINYNYPFIPIQMTLINGLTIGIPAFILALEPNHLRVNGKFLINVVSKALPSGLTTVFNIIILVILASLFKLSDIQTSTLAVIITGYTALLLIYRISKPLNLLRKSLLITLCTLFILALIIPIARSWYSIVLPNPNALLILIFLMYISTRIFKFLSMGLNRIIQKYNRWFI